MSFELFWSFLLQRWDWRECLLGSLCFSYSMKSKLGVMIWLGYLIWRSYDYGRFIMWFLTKIKDVFFFPHHRINIGGSAFVGRDASRERLPPRIDARGAGEEVWKRPHPKAFGDFPLRIHVSPQRRQKRGSGQDVSGKSLSRVSDAFRVYFHVVRWSCNCDKFGTLSTSSLRSHALIHIYSSRRTIISWCRAFPMDWES